MVFFDLGFILILQSLLPYWVWDLLNQFGSEIVYVGVLGIAYWSLNKREARLAVNIVMFSMFFNILLKYAFRMERPPASVRHNPEYAADVSYGFPSGASQTSMTLWGWVSLKIRYWWVWLVGALLVAISALSRVGLGLHWVGDVIGGICIGIIFVVMAYFIVPFLKEKGTQMPHLLQDWFLPCFALIFIGLFSAAYAILIIPYFPTENIAVSMGVIFGFNVGATLEGRFVDLTTDVPRNIRLFRAIIGIVLAILIYLGLSFTFDLLVIGALFVVKFIKYAIVGFFGAFLFPLFFKRLNK